MKKALFFMLSLLAFAACEAELDSIYRNQSMATKEVSKSNNIISADDAAKMALEFRKSLLAGNGMTRSAANAGGVSSVYAWRSRDVSPKAFTRSSVADMLPDTLLYIVNFEQNSGYALVSATKELPGVVAYIEEGALTPDDEIDNPGFLEFLESYEESYASMRDSNLRFIIDSLTPPLKPIDTTAVLMDSIVKIESAYQMEEYVAPLLATKWGQSSPYNWCCPLYDPVHGIHMYAGCAAIAIGQVVAYYQHPSSYNGHIYDWDAILQDSIVSPNNTAGANSVAELIHDIGLMIHMNYGHDHGSSAQFDSISYCLDTLGYHYDYNHLVTNMTAIKADIRNNHPVIIMGFNTDPMYYGNRHGWVIDGLAVKSLYLEGPGCDENGRPIIIRYTKEYVHCNWGDDGAYNGWFMFQSFQTMWNIQTDETISNYTNTVLGPKNSYNILNLAYHNIYPIP